MKNITTVPRVDHMEQCNASSIISNAEASQMRATWVFENYEHANCVKYANGLYFCCKYGH